MTNCEHSKLYVMDFANQPQRVERCILCERNEALSKLDALRPLVEEVMQSHRDKESVEYNECEIDECYWCECARKALND